MLRGKDYTWLMIMLQLVQLNLIKLAPIVTLLMEIIVIQIMA